MILVLFACSAKSIIRFAEPWRSCPSRTLYAHLYPLLNDLDGKPFPLSAPYCKDTGSCSIATFAAGLGVGGLEGAFTCACASWSILRVVLVSYLFCFNRSYRAYLLEYIIDLVVLVGGL